MTHPVISALERAGEGSRELDALIHTAATGEMAMKDPWGHWCKGDDWQNRVALDLKRFEVPHYTTSLDAALTLVPEGCHWSIEPGIAWIRVLTENDVADFQGFKVGSARTALALCIASLRARGNPK